jgi:spore coat protein U-like protein
MDRMIRRISVFAVLVFLFFSPSAEALRFQGAAPTVNNAVFLLDQEVIISQTITVRKQKREITTDFFITFSPGLHGSFSDRVMETAEGSPMYYNIYDNSTSRTVLKDLTAQPTSSEVLSGSFDINDNTAMDLSFVVILDMDQFPLAGTYLDEVAIELYGGSPENPDSPTPLDTTTMSLSATMDPVMEMSLVPEGGTFNPSINDLTLDFGILSVGDSRAADLLVRSNSTYSVLLRSANGGKMPIQSDPADTSEVPYLLSVNGNSLDLSGGTDQTAVPSAGPSTENGARYTLEVEILDFGMATEGLYSDILTITLMAQ